MVEAIARDPERLGVYSLTKDEAALRSATISDVSYRLRLVVGRGTTYEGTVDVNFNVVKEEAPALWLDFKATEVHSLKVNGTEVTEISWVGGKLALGNLPQGAVHARVIFKNDYSTSGCGLHHFVDPEDGEEYLYTQFEPFYAHRMFPCFDQPDLKATFELSVSAPAEWKVISNTLVVGSEDPELPQVEGRTVTVFKPTLRISTYLYAVCAGPYVEFRVDENELGIPLGFYCRKTLAKHMVVELYSVPTILGFKFYNEYFDFTYPFEKYDQVFVPEFNFGAMENVGCVVYRDQFIFKEAPSQNDLIRVSHVFLHEMAHMWFGNLVTMKWWDDLWLNESFADYICFYAIDKGLPGAYPEVWQSFLDSKGWGYDTDQLPTTHPISCIVNSTDEVETNFDGISYSKGAACLQQLSFLVGEENFRTGLRKYMHKYQFSNSTFENLITMLNEEVEIDLHQWADSWIKTAGLNEIQPVLHTTEGRLDQLEIQQRAALADHATLRSHKIKAELYDSELNLESSFIIQVQPQESTIVSEVESRPAPSFVLLNSNDQDYVKFILTSQEIKQLKDSLYKITDPLARQIIYRSVWEQVRDLKVSGAEFVDLVVSNLPNEHNLFNVIFLLLIASEALDDYVPSGEANDAFSHSIFEAVVEKMKEPAVTPETILQLQKYIFIYANHTQDVEAAVHWLEAKSTGIPGFELTQGDRWKILKKFSARNIEHASALVAAESQEDSSDTGKYGVLYCQAASPSAESKATHWNKFVSEGETMSRYERNSAMAGFNQHRQESLLQEYSAKFFDSLHSVIATSKTEFSYDFTENLLPQYVEEATLIPLIKSALSQVPEGHAKISRFFIEKANLLEKHRVGKELSANYLANKA
mmetsp:Transcript_20458/g.38299  ORF Transcript_20458/g.38299 Transcript_20458/m.38299 type:complete len:871 (-) Transcript_20458:81-2693(-)